MTLPLLPKATAVWLVENTALTFEQIADFCGLHRLEVQAIADGDAANGLIGVNPVLSGQLSETEIKRCENDETAKLAMLTSELPKPIERAKGPRYTSISHRADKPDAIAWVLKNHPEISDTALSRLLGTTRDTIEKIRTRTHWNAANIKPRHPVLLGLCSSHDLETIIAKATRRANKDTSNDDKNEQLADDSDIVDVGIISDRDAEVLGYEASDDSEDL